ncbi:Beta-galactosidase C-terminal domain [Pedobacter riviphilus]|nr:Beta-galactosidase C-terminal domain [Pedobacter riviphilus]
MVVNYSSTDYTFNLPKTAQLVIGTKTLSPAGVLVWTE